MNPPTYRTTKRASVRVPCPECEAFPGEDCFDRGPQVDTYRESSHSARHAVAIRAGAPAVDADTATLEDWKAMTTEASAWIRELNRDRHARRLSVVPEAHA